MSQNKPLTARQYLFCIHYCANDLNGAKAARLAGYAEDSCNVKAAQLLAKVSIQERIAELMAKTVEKARIGADEIYEFASRGAFFDIGEVLEMDESGARLKDGKKLSDLPKEVRQLIQSVKSKPTQFGIVNEIVFVDKMKNLEMLARFNGMNRDKLEVTSDLTPAERQARIAELRAKMEGGQSDGPK